MQKTLIFISFLLIIAFSLVETACTSDQLLEPPPLEFCDTLMVSYNLQVKDIIDTNCAFSGCHVVGSSAPGNYSSFRTLEPFLTDREFRRFVVDLRNDPELGMPPNRESNPGPKDLTEEEFTIISCWIEAGYPEEM